MPRALSVLGVVCLASLSACTSHGSSGCSTPSKDVVSSVMSHARSHFPFGASTIDHVTLIRAKQVSLPSDVQGASGVAVLALRTIGYFASPVSSALAGAQATDLFLLDKDGTVVGPVGEFATKSFDYPTPTASDWAAVSTKVEGSDAVETVRTCASS